MEVVNRMLAVLGQILLWVSTALVLEELTLGGLARLLLSTAFDARERRVRSQETDRQPVKRNEVWK
jgi:hypothetical protein